MQIKVKTMEGKIIPMWVEPSYTVESVKVKIENKLGIPPIQQQLQLLQNGSVQHLKEERTLYDYKITNQSDIYLVLQSTEIDICCDSDTQDYPSGSRG